MLRCDSCRSALLARSVQGRGLAIIWCGDNRAATRGEQDDKELLKHFLHLCN